VIVDTSVRQIEGLGGCSSLAHLTLKCRSLRTLDALEGSSTLETLDLSYCGSLQSLEGLRGCAALTTLRMIDGGAAPLEPLGACTALTDLDVSDSRLRTTLAGLEGHPALQRIRLDKSGVADLDGLAGCAALEEVHGKGAFSLADISGLGDCPSLTKLDFYGSKLPRFLQRTFESVSLLDLRYALSEYADVFASGALQTERLLEVLDQNLGLLCFSGMLSGVSDEKFEVVHELGPHQHMVFGQIFGLDPNDPNQRIERKVDLLSLWSDVCTWHRNFDAEIKQKHPDPKVLVTHHRKALVVGAVLSRLEKGAAYVIGEDSLSMSTNPRHPVYWVGLHDGAVIGVRSVVVWA
jgi:hypothetical protein